MKERHCHLLRKKKLEIVTKGLSLFITGAVGIYLDLLIGSFAHQYNRIFTKITHTHKGL